MSMPTPTPIPHDRGGLLLAGPHASGGLSWLLLAGFLAATVLGIVFYLRNLWTAV